MHDYKNTTNLSRYNFRDTSDAAVRAESSSLFCVAFGEIDSIRQIADRTDVQNMASTDGAPVVMGRDLRDRHPVGRRRFQFPIANRTAR